MAASSLPLSCSTLTHSQPYAININMKPTLLTLATLGGATALVLPAGYAGRLVLEPEVMAVRSVDGSKGYSVPLHQVAQRDFNDQKQTRAFAMRQADQLHLRYGNLSRTVNKRNEHLHKRQMTGLITGRGD